ncbi:hypothetical protein H072_2729 [Dactylellina haptotyla CBS 200.50]|uniref:Methylated-DNA--protein-cysteine methyltransferase n=1 Tax=Dactylellina haptotyla (strain CBS 200.50) TaxID=1284197 RepID=S8AQB5_DACHA|nr:hypothetical protein H072_2729 [Dactylellina haptotyla CBS 200.50]
MPAVRTFSSLPSRASKKAMATACGMNVSIATPAPAGKKGSKAVQWAPVTLPSSSKSLKAMSTKKGSSSSTTTTAATTKQTKDIDIGPAHPENTFEIPEDTTITEYQKKVYALLLQIPPGKITTYAHLSAALASSPRGVGTALRRNPYAPDVPCHRVIATTGYVGGFMGDWNDAPSGVNIEKKLDLLKDEGVEFDQKGFIREKTRIWKDFSV